MNEESADGSSPSHSAVSGGERASDGGRAVADGGQRTSGDGPAFDVRRDTPARELATDCLRAAIAAAHPERVVADAVRVDDGALVVADARYDLDDFEEVVVLGGGKAADAVADALERILGDRLSGGVVVTPNPADASGPVERRRGAHPVPDDAGVAGAEAVADRARDAGEGTLVLAVMTGGGSACLPAPTEGVSLSDLQTTTDALLASGASIEELNAVRKHLSTLKGGGLARLAAPATVVTLAFSDVVGDDLSVIASGPTVPDESTFADATAVVDRYDLDVPSSVRDRLAAGVAGDVPETPKPGDPVFERVSTHVLANTMTALEAARDVAADAGYATTILSSRVRGEARESAKTHVAVAEEALASGNPVEPPVVLLSGGECTVTVRGAGDGGPNQEFCLSAALSLPEGVTLGSVDTDGIDGASDAAGGLVDARTVGADDVGTAQEALDSNDAGTYLRAADDRIVTGPTGTNVNDVRVLVVDRA